MYWIISVGCGMGWLLSAVKGTARKELGLRTGEYYVGTRVSESWSEIVLQEHKSWKHVM